MRAVSRLQVAERAITAAKVDQWRGGWAFAEMDHTAEHDDMVPNVDLTLDLTANGREGVADERRAVVRPRPDGHSNSV